MRDPQALLLPPPAPTGPVHRAAALAEAWAPTWVQSGLRRVVSASGVEAAYQRVLEAWQATEPARPRRQNPLLSLMHAEESLQTEAENLFGRDAEAGASMLALDGRALNA